jgi:hypothetical protein
VGLEDSPGVVVPEDKMTSLGGSEYGSSFLIAQEIKGENIGRDPNFKTRRVSINWNAESNAHALSLISCSIHNIKSFLKSLSNVKEVSFIGPEDLEYFKKPWENSPGLINCSLDLIVDDIKIVKKTCKDIEDVFEEIKDK